jgi:hypothetical protein
VFLVKALRSHTLAAQQKQVFPGALTRFASHLSGSRLANIPRAVWCLWMVIGSGGGLQVEQLQPRETKPHNTVPLEVWTILCLLPSLAGSVFSLVEVEQIGVKCLAQAGHNMRREQRGYKSRSSLSNEQTQGRRKDADNVIWSVQAQDGGLSWTWDLGRIGGDIERFCGGLFKDQGCLQGKGRV